MPTQTYCIDSLRSRDLENSASHGIRPFWSFDGFIEHPTCLHNAKHSLHTGNTEMASSKNFNASNREDVSPIVQAGPMLCSEEWLSGTKDSDEAAFCCAHPERNRSVLIDEDFRGYTAIMLEHGESRDDWSPDWILENAVISYNNREHCIAEEHEMVEDPFPMLGESGVPSQGHTEKTDLSLSKANPSLHRPKLRKTLRDQHVKWSAKEKRHRSKRRCLRSTRTGIVRAQDMKLNHGYGSPARIHRVLVEGGPESGAFSCNHRTNTSFDTQSARTTSAKELLKSELRSTLGVYILVCGNVMPPAFCWEETTQMFTCVDEITRETAQISKDEMQKLMTDSKSSILIDWEKLLE